METSLDLNSLGTLFSNQRNIFPSPHTSTSLLQFTLVYNIRAFLSFALCKHKVVFLPEFILGLCFCDVPIQQSFIIQILCIAMVQLRTNKNKIQCLSSRGKRKYRHEHKKWQSDSGMSCNRGRCWTYGFLLKGLLPALFRVSQDLEDLHFQC